MKTILLFYVIAQLVSNAYGIAVIESLRPLIKSKLNDKAYVEKNKNSLYKYNDTFINILKGFIPFYYTIKAVNLITEYNPIDTEVNKMISSGKYITKEADEIRKSSQEDAKKIDVPVEPEIVFEKPERYTARKNDNSLYDTYITPVEYVTKETANDQELSITPFCDRDRVVEHVIVKEDVTKNDIAKAISQLNVEELSALNDTITQLSEIKKRNKKLELKDVA